MTIEVELEEPHRISTRDGGGCGRGLTEIPGNGNGSRPFFRPCAGKSQDAATPNTINGVSMHAMKWRDGYGPSFRTSRDATTLRARAMPARLLLSWGMKTLKLFLLWVLESLEFGWQAIRYALILGRPILFEKGACANS